MKTLDLKYNGYHITSVDNKSFTVSDNALTMYLPNFTSVDFAKSHIDMYLS